MVNLRTVYDSLRPLKGAVEAIAARAQVVHLPDYGVIIATSNYVPDPEEFERSVEQLRTTLLGLGGMVEGLPADEKVVVALHSYRGDERHTMVVMQMSSGDPTTLEVLFDGQPR